MMYFYDETELNSIPKKKNSRQNRNNNDDNNDNTSSSSREEPIQSLQERTQHAYLRRRSSRFKSSSIKEAPVMGVVKAKTQPEKVTEKAIAPRAVVTPVAVALEGKGRTATMKTEIKLKVAIGKATEEAKTKVQSMVVVSPEPKPITLPPTYSRRNRKVAEETETKALPPPVAAAVASSVLEPISPPSAYSRRNRKATEKTKTKAPLSSPLIVASSAPKPISPLPAYPRRNRNPIEVIKTKGLTPEAAAATSSSPKTISPPLAYSQRNRKETKTKTLSPQVGLSPSTLEPFSPHAYPQGNRKETTKTKALPPVDVASAVLENILMPPTYSQNNIDYSNSSNTKKEKLLPVVTAVPATAIATKTMEEPLSPPSTKRSVFLIGDDSCDEDEDLSSVMTGFGSMDSAFYEKSVESEVEDALKDLLFIGSEKRSKPGRRERKANIDKMAATKSGSQQQQENDDVSDCNFGEETASFSMKRRSVYNSNDSSSSREKTNTQEEASIFSPTRESLASMSTEFLSSSPSVASFITQQDDGNTDTNQNKKVLSTTFFGGVSAVLSEAFGMTTNNDYDEEDSEDSEYVALFNNKQVFTLGNAMNYAADMILRPAAEEAQDIFLGPPPKITFSERTLQRDERKSKNPVVASSKKGNAMNYAADTILRPAADEVQDILLGPPPISTSSERTLQRDERKSKNTFVASSKKKPVKKLPEACRQTKDLVDATKSTKKQAKKENLRKALLEDDSRLADFALHTARAIHIYHGMKLNEYNNAKDYVTEFDFKVVQLAMPFGMLLEKNCGGCWVSQVFPDGNAAKCILVGDQLAAVNGRSAIKMTTEEVSCYISEVKKEQEQRGNIDALFELTLLRYTGELHPCNDEQQAIELTLALPTSATINIAATTDKENVYHNVVPTISKKPGEKKRKKKKIPKVKKWFQRSKKKEPEVLIEEDCQSI